MIAMLMIGQRFLDFSNTGLRYGQEAIVPFYIFHQPVIIVVAYYVVQWSISAPVKMLIVGVTAFAATLGIYGLLIRWIAPLRAAFGVKGKQE